MRVIFEPEIFVSSRVRSVDIVTLFRLGLEKRHLIQSKPIDAVQMINWLNKQSMDIREECQLALDSGVNLDRNEYEKFSPLTIQVADIDSPLWYEKQPQLPINEALRFLQQPFTIFLENRRNDQAFLKTVATGWRKQRLLQLLEKDWIQFGTGGGIGEVKKWAEEIEDVPEKCLRGFALFDSDALKPNEPSKESASTVNACVKATVCYHRLERRAIENYLPIQFLEQWMGEQVDKERKVMAFKKLTPEQRHHFNMKKGFKGDFELNQNDKYPRREPKEYALVGDFYSSVNSDVRNALELGFGKDIAELFQAEQFKIQDQWFIDDGQTAEINPMLDKLLALI
jgi:hypothetical protein